MLQQLRVIYRPNSTLIDKDTEPTTDFLLLKRQLLGDSNKIVL